MSIDRRQNLSPRDFVREYLSPLRPVILTDSTSAWAALRKWTPEFFGERYGGLEVNIDGCAMALRELIARVLVSSPEHPAPYLRNQLLSQWPPELLADVTPLPLCTQPNWLENPFFPARQSLKYFEVYIGGRGATFPVLHYDGLHTHAVIMQIYGQKEFWVYPPEQSPFMYPRAGIEANKSLVNDVEDPDLGRFPLFAQARATRFVLNPGESLFVPAGWWHTTRLLSATISVSVNSANAANWRDFRQDFCAGIARDRGSLRARLTGVYLTLLGWALSTLEMLGCFL